MRATTIIKQWQRGLLTADEARERLIAAHAAGEIDVCELDVAIVQLS